MPIRSALARLALRDAERMEHRLISELRALHQRSEDPATRHVIQRILAEEEKHLRRLEAARGELPAAPEASVTPPESASEPWPPLRIQGAEICDQLRSLVEVEEASATFYELLAQRALLRPVREVFATLACEERAHAETMRHHLRRLCADPPEAD